MSITVRRKKKIIKECDCGGCDCGGGMPTAPFSTLNNTGGIGNPVPPSENSAGSGDNWGNVFPMATQAAPKYKYKLRRKKTKK